MKIIKQRPHHILCFWKWQGIAYDELHAQSLLPLNKQLKNPETKVLITMEEDSFCKACPHGENRNKTCHKEFVESLDEKLAFLLGVEDGGIYNCAELINRLKNTVTIEIRNALCGGCGWWKKGKCEHVPTEEEAKKLAEFSTFI